MRIALISDIHYGRMSTTSELAIQGEPLSYSEVDNDFPLFQGLIDILSNEQIDYLFIAGDITSTGNPLEFKMCFEKIFDMASKANIPKENVLICLGNHDVDWRITKIVNKFKDEEKCEYSNDDMLFLKKNYNALANGWVLNDKCSFPVDKNLCSDQCTDVPFTGVVERDDCIVFLLNSGHLCTHDKSKKHGCLSIPQLRWFKDVVHQHSSSAKVKIVLLHHHPFSYQYPNPVRDMSLLEEGSEFYDICGKNDIAMVLHGHRHHPKAKTVTEQGWVNPVTYICAGSLSVDASHRRQNDICIPNTFHIIEYNSRERILLKNFEYSFADGWILTKTHRDEVPLEGCMLLGKPVNLDDKTTIDLIKQLPIGQPNYYDSLNNDLSYLRRHELRDTIERTLNGCKVYEKMDHFLILKIDGGVVQW